MTHSRFAIRYVSRYQYSSEVADNLNALRVRPAGGSHQTLEEFGVRLTPDVRQQHHRDYFGTEVVEFEVARPHRELVIDVRARVRTDTAPAPPPSDWEAMRTVDYRESAGEFLFLTDDAPDHPELASLIDASRTTADPLAAVLGLSELIPDRFEYRSGATYVDSPLSAVLDGGAGVCQDFVNLGLCVLRHLGIGARYVSGYLFAVGPDDVDGHDSVSLELDTHAWLEALVPAADGGEPAWVGIDPTNRGLTGPHHVKIGHGRQYSDVPPIKGVYRGAAESTVEAHVTMTRIADDGPSPPAG